MKDWPTYLSPEAALDYLRNSTRTVIVDVREEDRAGGHIKGSYHIPAPKFLRNPARYLSLADDADRIIFHCMFSQSRGPTCANAFVDQLVQRIMDDPDAPSPEVCVLSGGFRAFAKLVTDGNMDVVEDFDPTYYM